MSSPEEPTVGDDAPEGVADSVDPATIERQLRRQEIAAVINAEVEHCRSLFPDATAFGRWRIVDRSGVEPDRLVYCSRRSGQQGWQPSCDAPDERLPDGRFRYECRFTSLAEYHPVAPEVLQRRNATRKANARRRQIEAEKRRMPLFADQIGE